MFKSIFNFLICKKPKNNKISVEKDKIPSIQKVINPNNNENLLVPVRSFKTLEKCKIKVKRKYKRRAIYLKQKE